MKLFKQPSRVRMFQLSSRQDYTIPVAAGFLNSMSMVYAECIGLGQ